jgi:hypothetical protein
MDRRVATSRAVLRRFLLWSGITMIAIAPRREGSRSVRFQELLLCAAVGALGLACGIGVDGDDTAPPPPSTCTTVRAAGPWWNQAFPDQARRFHAELDATPSASSIDAVVGLGNGLATRFDRLGAIVRFSPAGTIEARAGSEYRADVVQPYEAGQRYHLRLDVDVPTHTYSVWLRDAYGGYQPLARDYPFRTELAGVTRLNNAAGKVDSATGTLEICAFQVVADATTADGCLIVSAGDGFATAALPDATVLETLTFTVTPSAPDLDAVIGLSAGPATRFSDLATAVRLTPSGYIDARDGEVYRADVAQTYTARPLGFRVIADVTSHTYSVFQGTFREAQEVARSYRFRTSQGGVTHLDQLAAIVDGGQGSVTICQVHGAGSTGVTFSREGSYAVLPLAGNQALISDGAMTRRVDAAGTALAQVARGGELAVDAAGNVFIASVAETTLTVDKYDPGFGPRCRVTRSVLAGSTIQAMASDATGAVVIGLATLQDRQVTVARFTANCALAAQQVVSGEAVALDGDQPIVAWDDSGTLRITRFAGTGATVWTRAFVGSAGITAMAVDPSHHVLFGGELYNAMDFGGGTLPKQTTPDGEPLNGFLVKLSVTGAHVFSRKTGYSLVGGIAANDAQIAVSGTERTQFVYLRFQRFDPSGAPIASPDFDTGFGENGVAGRVAIGASGRVWWNLETSWPLFPRWPYLVVLNP